VIVNYGDGLSNQIRIVSSRIKMLYTIYIPRTILSFSSPQFHLLFLISFLLFLTRYFITIPCLLIFVLMYVSIQE